MITFEIPVRRFRSSEVAALADLMRKLSTHPELVVDLIYLPGTIVGDYLGQHASEWLRVRAAELPWADRMIAMHPNDDTPLHGGFNRRSAEIYARGATAYVPFDRPQALRLELSCRALGLVRHIGAVVSVMEGYAQEQGERARGTT